MIEDIVGRVSDGRIIPRNINSQRRSQFSGVRRARASLRRVFRAIGRKGIAHVGDELMRQKEAK